MSETMITVSPTAAEGGKDGITVTGRDCEGLEIPVLIWMPDTWVYSIFSASLSCALVKRTFLYAYLIKYTYLRKTKIEKKPKVSKEK